MTHVTNTNTPAEYFETHAFLIRFMYLILNRLGHINQKRKKKRKIQETYKVGSQLDPTISSTQKKHNEVQIPTGTSDTVVKGYAGLLL